MCECVWVLPVRCRGSWPALFRAGACCGWLWPRRSERRTWRKCSAELFPWHSGPAEATRQHQEQENSHSNWATTCGPYGEFNRVVQPHYFGSWLLLHCVAYQVSCSWVISHGSITQRILQDSSANQNQLRGSSNYAVRSCWGQLIIMGSFCALIIY